MLWIATLLACIRPTDGYEVEIYDANLQLDEALSAPEPYGGQIEVARMHFWGSNLGYGLTNLYGDLARADGQSLTIGMATLGYPATPDYDRNSVFLSAGPPAKKGDQCITRMTPAPIVGPFEYVDVGDHIQLSGGGVDVRLDRDPAAHPRPAGESYYAGYGGTLQPSITAHDSLPLTWKPGQALDVRFPGTVAPVEATFGAIPYPLERGSLKLPPSVDDLRVNDAPVRPPEHTEEDDPVRFTGPFYAPMTLSWTPSEAGTPLTVVVRYLGWGADSDCDCTNTCPTGFTCEYGACSFDDGSGWAALGETVCTVEDDGEFTMYYGDIQALDLAVPPYDYAGSVLIVSRIEEGRLAVPDAVTYNGGRVDLGPIRTRAIDAIYTRLDL